MKHLQIALSQARVREISGNVDNPEIIKYFTELGFQGSSWKDETAWCSAWLNWVCKRSGLPYTGKLNAKSWLDIGEQVFIPEAGDIVIFHRGSPTSWQGHVGIYCRTTKDDKWIIVLGGNQNNEVKFSYYRKSRLAGYRRLT